ncbi:unnamed protein product [Rotaria magnacalcarata]|uniref:Uncharacterized protein n=1 Tax=Rotaria magnacalcarata TaxID=392030 RepID=A0A8S3BA87_9BILA|nr:unnamed protein product [Rotaria magnacalcarata]
MSKKYTHQALVDAVASDMDSKAASIEFKVPASQWAIVNSSCRHAFESNGGTGKDYRTALICIAAGGQVLPPLLIYAGVWPFDENAMCHKVANNTSIYPTTQSSSIHHVPTNILQPRLVCATPSMSSNSTTISCSSTSSSYSPTVLTNKSIDTSTNIDQSPSSSSSLLNLVDPGNFLQIMNF